MSFKIVIIGAGGLGTPAAWALATADLTAPASHPPTPIEITIVDPDQIELSNLNRQVLFQTSDIGLLKAEILAARLSQLYPSANLHFIPIIAKLDESNIDALLNEASFVLECSDSTAAKFLVNDYCVTNGIPFVYAGVVGTSGQLLHYTPSTTQSASRGGCLRCLFGDFTESDYISQSTTCRQAGIIGPIAGEVGMYQGGLAAGFIAGLAPEHRSYLLRFNSFGLAQVTYPVPPSVDCPLGCGINNLTILDLRSRTCPSTFVFTKLALEQMAELTVIDARYSSAESARNVSRSLGEEGHRIIGSQQLDRQTWRVLIQKRTVPLEEKV
jgi:molybdopterin/thiamine biosynthesis adenylyltransferase